MWRAWHRLNLDRPWKGGGMGPPWPCAIPWRDVVLWCRVHGVQGDDVALYDACLTAMDSVFMDWHAQQARQAEQAGRRKGG